MYATLYNSDVIQNYLQPGICEDVTENPSAAGQLKAVNHKGLLLF